MKTASGSPNKIKNLRKFHEYAFCSNLLSGSSIFDLYAFRKNTWDVMSHKLSTSVRRRIVHIKVAAVGGKNKQLLLAVLFPDRTCQMIWHEDRWQKSIRTKFVQDESKRMKWKYFFFRTSESVTVFTLGISNIATCTV